MIEMENIKKAIRHFECMRDDARVVLDSGFGTHPGESDLVYRNRKMYAELAIDALKGELVKPAEDIEDLLNRLDEIRRIGIFNHAQDTQTIAEAIDIIHNLNIWKQVPRRPVEQSTHEKIHYKCICGKILRTEYEYGANIGAKVKYCFDYGQAIDWSTGSSKEE